MNIGDKVCEILVIILTVILVFFIILLVPWLSWLTSAQNNFSGNLQGGILIHYITTDYWQRSKVDYIKFNDANIKMTPIYGLPPLYNHNDCGDNLAFNKIKPNISYKAYLKSFGPFGLCKSIFVEPQ